MGVNGFLCQRAQVYTTTLQNPEQAIPWENYKSTIFPVITTLYKFVALTFSELALIHKKPRAASVFAETDITLAGEWP